MCFSKKFTGILSLKHIINFRIEYNNKKLLNLDTTALEIIYTKNNWNELLEEIGEYDFYHTYDYHMIEKPTDGYIVMLKYVENDIIIGIPFVVRKISNTDYFDATSVYGYSGPISKNVTAEFSNKKFLKKLLSFFKDYKIISVFTRLHPYIKNQNLILKNYGKLINHGKVVNIDLNLNLNIQNRSYQERLRTYINKSRRNSIIKKLESEEELREFIDIYYETMKRVSAEKYFYFNEDYFNKLLNSKWFNAEILLVKEIKSGNTIAGSLFVTTNNIVQYHLSCTRLEYSHLTPIKLLIDEMRIIATEKGLQYFNLGGGKGGKFNDSLFRFKSSFSKDFREFNTWHLIVNQSAYNELVKNHDVDEVSFFPGYRSSDKNLVRSAD